MVLEPFDEWIQRLAIKDGFTKFEEDARRGPGGVDVEARPLEGEAGSGFIVRVELGNHQGGVEFSFDNFGITFLYLTPFTAQALATSGIDPSRAKGRLLYSLSRNFARCSSLNDIT